MKNFIFSANQLAAALNDALRITEEAAVTVTSEVLPGYSPRGGRRKQRLPGVPAQKLQGISNNLNSQLTQLLVNNYLILIKINFFFFEFF